MGLDDSAIPTVLCQEHLVVEGCVVAAQQDHALRLTAQGEQLLVESSVIGIDYIFVFSFAKIGRIEVDERRWALQEHPQQFAGVAVLDTHMAQSLRDLC